ncbi:MAG: glycosyltransferase family 2 protein [Elusimicrobia bacterium]|nr:glycosyltransferase family 2 protein [Elusimicrobiota bacterium]MBU2614964.1 glycosyltransferase family 2 protein [Elusimicrobiota bacterium]
MALEAFIIFLIVINGFMVFFFLQFIYYGLFSYFCHWRKRYDLVLNQGTLDKIASDNSVAVPKITIVVPALYESTLITATIDMFVKLNYPKDKYRVLLVLDDKELFEKPYNETTHCFVEDEKERYNKLYGDDFIMHTSVPVKFDGNYPGAFSSEPVKSNKPRALNWVMSFIPKDTQIVGFYDADSQPDPDTLLYVAQKFIAKKDRPLLVQGPVVQVRNYFSLKVMNKIYALSQAITHEWFLPVLLRRLPFIGGTNFFIEPYLLYSVNGFDQEALSEDLELGCRLYIKEDVWPQFLPFIATEQTPPNYKSFFRQRVRWASGYMQVIKYMLIEDGSIFKRFRIITMLFLYGIFPWMTAQLLSVTTLGIFLLSLLGITRIFVSVPAGIKIFSVAMNFFYFIFLLVYLKHSINKFYILVKPSRHKSYGLIKYVELSILPIAALFGGLPYTYGFFASIFGRKKTVWVKTPRTVE